MKIFTLEKPVLDKIKTVVDAYFTAASITANIRYMDFEPSEGFVNQKKYDGAVAVYARKLDFVSGQSSVTGTQQSNNYLIVDVYGFGDPLKNDDDDFEPSIREAQNRGEILTTLSYKAIQDTTEINNFFGTGLQFSDKTPIDTEKFSPVGSLDSQRGTCIYRSRYKIGFEENPPTEVLGPDYTGSDWTLPTYNTGDEPE
jgi:hypothetical protein